MAGQENSLVKACSLRVGIGNGFAIEQTATINVENMRVPLIRSDR